MSAESSASLFHPTANLPEDLKTILQGLWLDVEVSLGKMISKKGGTGGTCDLLLSRTFVMYKLCELLEETEYLPCFPLNATERKEQDDLWRQISEDIGWRYYPTV